VQQHFSRWRDVYNLERPHEALKMAVPASRYQPSPRSYTAHPAAAEYDDGVAVRKVDSSGWLNFYGEKLKVGKGFIRERLGIKESSADGVYEVWWYSHKVGVIDLKKRSIQIGKQC
ncbi:MAG: IS481 family transposase, partial [Hafnia sp.]